MQGLQKSVVLAAALAWSASALPTVDPDLWFSKFGPEPQGPPLIAERTEKRLAYQPGAGKSAVLSEISAPGASFIKVHFSHFLLPPGVAVEVSNPNGTESWRYSSNERDPFTFDLAAGDDGKQKFSAMSITGDAVVVSLIGDLNSFDPELHRVEIDSYLEGIPLESGNADAGLKEKSADLPVYKPETDCGNSERYGAACWASSHPWEYARSAAVAKLITSKGEVCTAWRVGANNHMFTAEHCLGKQSELDGAEIWFNYEATACGSSQNTQPVKVTGGSLLSNDREYDYALFTVSNFSAISEFPAFGLDVSSPIQGEEIFIPQHGLGRPRQIALDSDMNDSGRCEVDEANKDGYEPGSDIGYYCDTTTSSSGAPVVSMSNGRVIALHHFGGCVNAGVKFSKIWTEVSSYFGGAVPNGNSGGAPAPDNQAPLAEYSASCGELTCSFDASDSKDVDGEIVAYDWNLSDGGSANGQGFEHQFAEVGLYSITLTVEDNEGSTDSYSSTVEVTLPNQSPTAKITTSCIDNSCEFSAGGSSDPDGQIISYDWYFGDGVQASGENQNHVYQGAGTYTVTLTVEDDDGGIDTASHTLSPSMPNESPLAIFDFSCEELNCIFEAGSSMDPDGNIASWSWDFGDGGAEIGASVSHSYASGGTFKVELTVEDDDGAKTSEIRSVKVEQAPPNRLPEADFSYRCDHLSCTFDASSSADADGLLTQWIWNFGDGGEASGAFVSHDYESSGTFTVTLRIADNEGASDNRSRTVSVSMQEQPNQAPNASYSYSCDKLFCEFNATASSDSDGSITEMNWRFGDGQVASGQKVNHHFADTGRYEVTLTVMDNENAYDSKSRVVEVEEQIPEIKLTGQGARFNGRSLATLSWTGAESSTVDVFRDGLLVATTSNDGKHLDTKLELKAKSAVYSVCQTGSDHCSGTLTLFFTP